MGNYSIGVHQCPDCGEVYFGMMQHVCERKVKKTKWYRTNKLLFAIAVILLCLLFLLAIFPDKAAEALTVRHGPPDCRPGQDCLPPTRTPFYTATPECQRGVVCVHR